MPLRYALPAGYGILALLAWWDLAAAPPDGLANLGLMLAVLPVTLAGLAIGWVSGAEGFVLLPEGLGYSTSHAAYFFPSAALIAAALWRLGRAIDRRRA